MKSNFMHILELEYTLHHCNCREKSYQNITFTLTGCEINERKNILAVVGVAAVIR